MAADESTVARRQRRFSLSPAVTLFTCMFAAQSSLLVLSPILPLVALEFDMSTAAAGQLRSVSGGVAAAVAIGLAVVAVRRSLRDLLVLGLGLLALGGFLSSIALSFAVLTAAQVIVGAGLGLVVSCGLAAAAEWVGSGERIRVLSWTLTGQPVAWIVGMPLIGAIASYSWRLAWLLVPCVASVVALVGALTRERTQRISAAGRPLWRISGLGQWVTGETLAYAGWAGLLVYTGALFAEVHGAPVAVVGVLLALGAAAYLPGNFLARRLAATAGRGTLIALAITMAGFVALFGVVRPALGFSLAVFMVLGFLGGARTLISSSFGIAISEDDMLRATSLRTMALQLGYLLGTAIGGIGLAVDGWRGLGIALAALFALAAAPHLLRGAAEPRTPA